MGLFSFGKKKEPEEYYPDSPDRAFDEKADRMTKNFSDEVEYSIMTYIYKLFRNSLFAIDKIEELNTKIGEVNAKMDRIENILLKQNQDLQQKNSMLEAELEHTERHK